jgi:hypothetical protein
MTINKDYILDLLNNPDNGNREYQLIVFILKSADELDKLYSKLFSCVKSYERHRAADVVSFKNSLKQHAKNKEDFCLFIRLTSNNTKLGSISHSDFDYFNNLCDKIDGYVYYQDLKTLIIRDIPRLLHEPNAFILHDTN